MGLQGGDGGSGSDFQWIQSGGGRFNFNSSDSGSPLRVSLEDQDRQKLEVL